MKSFLVRIGFMALLLAAPVGASAQSSYPERTVRFVVSAAAGGGTDIIARLVGQQLNALGDSRSLSRTGPAAPVTSRRSSSRAPNRTATRLFVTFGGVLTINPFLFKEMGFDPDKDFVPGQQCWRQRPPPARQSDGDPVQDGQGIHHLSQGAAGKAELGRNDQGQPGPPYPASCSA